MIEFKKQYLPIKGDIKIQGDNKISYLSLFLACLSTGNTKIYNLLETEEILNLIKILKNFNIDIKKENDYWNIGSQGFSSLKEPINIIDVKNFKTTLFFLISFFSSYNFKLFFKGDDSLFDQDLTDIFAIFKSLDIVFNARNNENLPFLMMGKKDKKKLEYKIEEYDSFLKEILLLSSITSNQENTILEIEKSTNHLENLMKFFGILFDEHEIGNKGNLVTKIGKEIIIKGNQTFSSKDLVIAGDISFSSFLSALTILIPESNITLKNVLMNQYRDAFYRTLVDFGIDIKFINQKVSSGEKVCDINIKYSQITDTIIPANRIYKMIYEYPVLIFIASVSNTNTEIQGIKYIKENDLKNYEFIIKTLKELGIDFIEHKDSLKIKGGIKNLEKKILIDNDNISENVKLTTALFGLFLNNSVELNQDIEKYFPDLANFLINLNLNINKK